MANALRQLKLEDFSGGLNLNRSQFTLGPTESPEMLNVEFSSGGIRTRRGWERWGDVVPAADWNPRTAFLHERSSGQDSLLIANGSDNKLYWSFDGDFVALKADSVDAVCSAGVHVADYAAWGDTVFIVRGNEDVLAWDGVSVQADDFSAVPDATNWSPDYTAPVSQSSMVRANFVASHGGRVWVASTFEENGEFHPHRVRWSHPNQPGAWSEDDFIDILVGGGPITGIVPMSDHLLVFKASSIFAIYGYDGESQQLVNVSWTKGARNRQLIAKSESSCYFMSFADGVYSITDSQRPQEISVSLRPLVSSDYFNRSAGDNQWLGWLGKRLWWAVPFSFDKSADDASVVFVFDPQMSGGSWTVFEAAGGGGLGPFAQGAYSQASIDMFGCLRSQPGVVRVEASEAALDVLAGGVGVPFRSSYTTRWLDAGYTDLKKRWKRPTFVASGADVGYKFRVGVRRDFENAIVRRFDVVVDPEGVGARYGSGAVYGGGAVYSGSLGFGSQLEKGSSLGTMASTQLRIDGALGVSWGLSSIVFKYRSRRLT